MATSSIDLLSVISGIQVTSSDILQAELLLTQVLAAQDPTLDLRTGTAIRDLAVRPNATLLATINKALVYYWTQNSLTNVTDSTPTVFVDKMLSNFFMTRYAGANAVINVRLYFAKALSVTLSTDLYFSPDNVLMYYPITSATYPASQLVFDPSSGQYYLSVNLVAAAAGTSYNLSSGSLIYFSNFNPYFLHAEINYLSSTANNVETNTQFISRASTSISTRNLINTPSITSNLTSAFPIISQITSIGMGDTSMIRDAVEVAPSIVPYPIWIHIGSAMDIYCNTPLTSSLVQFTTDTTGKLQLTGPIYKTAISGTAGGPNADTILVGTPYTSTNNYLDSVLPTALTSSAGVATVTYAQHGLSVGERFIMSGADQSAYNGTFQVASVLSDSSFTYVVAGTPVTPATGIFNLQRVSRPNEVGFSPRQILDLNFAGPVKSVTAVSSVTTGTYTTVVTVTVPGHGYSLGNIITITGLSAGNGNYPISSVTTNTFQYTFNSTSSPGTITYTTATAQAMWASQSVSLNISYIQGLDGIQTYLVDPANKVLCADPLARGFNLIMLDVSIVGYGITAPSQQTASTVVQTYLASLAPGQAFIMADLLSELYAAGITTIQTPLQIGYTKYWKDLFSPTTGSITDVLVPNDSTAIFKLNSLVTSVSAI